MVLFSSSVELEEVESVLLVLWLDSELLDLEVLVIVLELLDV